VVHDPPVNSVIADDQLFPRAKTSGPRSPAAAPEVEGKEPRRFGSWKHQAQRLRTEALVLYFVFTHPRVPWFAKWIAGCVAAYLLSPVQLIPSYIPVVGFLDDLLALFIAVKLLRRIIPNDVLVEWQKRAESAEMQRKDEIRSSAATAGLVAMVFLWLLAAVIASALIMNYIHR
jgi:uncharacterized membrane protein YkvA (DUF1232 family)